MGRKTNSVSLRLKNTNRDYNNCWYSDILYAYNFSKSLKLGNYLSQTLKTIEMPCPQASIIGAYKKASVLVCYLDPKKRIRLLEQSSRAQAIFPGFVPLKQKKQDKEALLSPLGALDSNFFYQHHPIETDSSRTNKLLFRTDSLKLQEKVNKEFSKKSLLYSEAGAGMEQSPKQWPVGNTLSKNLLNSSNPSFSLNTAKKERSQGHFKQSKVYVLPENYKASSCSWPTFLQEKKAFFDQRALGLELSKPILKEGLIDDQLCTNNQTPNKNHVVSHCNAFFPVFVKPSFNPPLKIVKGETIPLKTQKNKTPLVYLKRNSEKNFKLSWDQNIFPYVLETPPKQYSKFVYFSEKFYNTGPCTGIDFPVSAEEEHIQYQSRGYFPRKLFVDAEASLGITKSLSLVCALYKNLSIYNSKKGFNTEFFRQTSGIAYRKPLLQGLLSAPCQSPCLGIDPRKIVAASPSWNSNFFLEKWFGDQNYYRKNASTIKKMIVQKNVKNCSLTNLYQFYHGFSRFWENVVLLSFYKSTNEICCSLFLADTVAYLLEKKVLFRSIKRQLLLELNASNKSFKVLESSLFSKIKDLEKEKKITGIRISCSGRVGGRSKKAQRSRKDTFIWGETGLHVFSNKLDFAKTHAETPFGTVGVQVWINMI